MKLFEQLFTLVEEFIRLGRLAVTKQSDYGRKHNRPTESNKAYWLDLVKDISDTDDELKQLVEEGIEKNLEEIDVQLDEFRSLARRMDYNNCCWSAYYNDIRDTMKKMNFARRAIDKEYGIGK